MKVAHFDAFSGISGDMILASLLDLYGEEEKFASAIQSLRLRVSIKINQVQRASFRAKRVEIIIPEDKASPPRKWEDIEKIINASHFSSWVKKKSREIFRVLFEAEAKVHGQPIEQIHLHEAGADDALTDIIGSCWLIEKMGLEKITCSPINLGSGWVKTSHGLLPVPPPAVAEILKNVPVLAAGVKEELTTPTGAAIISCLASEFLSFPEIIVNRIGYGAGSRDFPFWPNILRVFLGEDTGHQRELPIYEIKTNLDDASPQILAHACELALAAGALDAFQTPVFMKKGRLASQLTVLAPADKIDKIFEILFRETGTLGLRYHPVRRLVLERKEEKVDVLDEEVKVKVAHFDGQEVKIQPEYDDCQRIAIKKGFPLRTIQQLAVDIWKKIQSNR